MLRRQVKFIMLGRFALRASPLLGDASVSGQMDTWGGVALAGPEHSQAEPDTSPCVPCVYVFSWGF